MSQAQSQIPDVQSAHNTLFTGLYADVFFRKAAAANMAPRTEEEARAMLETAGKLRVLRETSRAKQAAANDSPFQLMSVAVDAELGRNPNYRAIEYGYKQAAAHYANVPEFYNAALALKAAEAEELQAQYNAWSANNNAA